MANKIRKPGSGRTHGSFSFVNITLEQLNQKLNDKNTPIRMSRKQAEAFGFAGLVTQSVGELESKAVGFTPDKPAIHVKNLNDE
jgi:hypothetical protein